MMQISECSWVCTSYKIQKVSLNSHLNLNRVVYRLNDLLALNQTRNQVRLKYL